MTCTSRCLGCGYYEDEVAGWCEGGPYGTAHNFVEVDADGMALGPPRVDDFDCEELRVPLVCWQHLRGVRRRAWARITF